MAFQPSAHPTPTPLPADPTVGNTPAIRLSRSEVDLGIAELWCKAEHLNPTGSYKDRVADRACAIAVDRGMRGLLGTSSGNGAAAAAAFGARHGLDVCILTVPGAPSAKLATALAHGATLIPVEGLGWTPGDTRRTIDQVVEIAERYRMYPFVTAWRYAPEAMAAVSQISVELFASLPQLDAVYVPVGGGGLLTSIGDGYRGCEHAPRIVGVQPAGSGTLARALNGDLSAVEAVTTTISGLQVPELFDPEGAIDAVTSTGGHITSITDQQAWSAQRILARSEGVLVEPAGAVALAGVIADLQSGRLTPTDRVAVIASGAGWKDTGALDRLSSGGFDEVAIPVSQLEARIAQSLNL